jgi:hypothetical protein
MQYSWIERLKNFAKSINQADRSQRTRDKAQEHEDRAKIAAVLLRLLIHIKAKEKQRKKGKTKNRFLICLDENREWLTFIVVAFAAGFACLQWVAIRGQWNQMVEESRPWIKPTGMEITKFAVEKNQVSVTANFSYLNVGKSPAQPVLVSPNLVILAPGEFEFKKVKLLCANPFLPKVDAIGKVAFPGDPMKSGEINFGLPISKAREIQKLLLDDAVNSFRIGFGSVEAERLREGMQATVFQSAFDVMGCINYRSSDGIHQSSFIFRVSKAPSEESPNKVIDTSVERDVPLNDLVVETVDQFGIYAN